MNTCPSSELLKKIASHLNVIPAVHSEDMIMRYLLENPCFPTKADAISYYFNDGAKSCQQLSDLLHYIGASQKTFRLLEFACGYGCVTRHIASRIKSIELTCSDIHPQAMEFINKTLCIKNIYLSATNPNDFDSGGNFDVVFALSFFSHIPKSSWDKWLSRLYHELAPGGFLIFTTHGNESRKHFGDPAMPPDGFWFKRESEQKDLSTDDYGQTIVNKEYVSRTTRKILLRPIYLFREGFWWNHQDLYVFQRPFEA
jgi:SAM-dependent methyltransferase